MANKIKVTWEIEDGYAEKSRPQYTTIDIENDIGLDSEEWENLSEEEQQTHINEIVEDDFRNRINCYITNQKEI